jgi:hypothetical protein
MKGRITADMAVAFADGYGLDPAEPYPGRASDPWLLRCRTCKGGWRTTLTRIRSGQQCPHLGTPLYRRTRSKPGAVPVPLPEADAVARARAKGFTPCGAYPGSAVLPWVLRCDTCGGIRRCTASRLLHYDCRHTLTKKEASNV